MTDLLRRRQTIADESIRLNDRELVSNLSHLLGLKLVAYLGGVSETRAVREWADGVRSVGSVDASTRLRIAYQAARLIADNESAEIAQAWFRGLNPLLGDVAPARILRDEDLDAAGKDVLGAAGQFVVHG